MGKNYKEDTSVPQEETIVEAMFAKVSNCERLNIRKYASKNADVVTIVDAGDVLEAEVLTNNPEWMRVRSDKTDNKWCFAMSEFLELTIL